MIKGFYCRIWNYGILTRKLVGDCMSAVWSFVYVWMVLLNLFARSHG
jgi:hypothetical protein